MNEDFKVIHEILLDSTYNEENLIFELELRKIKDSDLRMGLLVELYTKPGFEADKSKILYMIGLFGDVNDITNTGKLNEYHQHFIDNFIPYHRNIRANKPSGDELLKCINFLCGLKSYPENVVWTENEEIVSTIKSLSPVAFKFLKDLLISKEFFNEVVYMDKCLEL